MELMDYAQRVLIIWGLSFVLSMQIIIYWGVVKDHSKWMKDYNEMACSSDDIMARKAKTETGKYEF